MQSQFNQNASSNSEDSAVQSILKPLHRQWQRLSAFMVLPEDASVKHSDTTYSAKARFYPYLPADEEARDWLEKIYQQD